MIETIVKLMGRSEWKSGRYLKVVDAGALKYSNFKSLACSQAAETLFFGAFSPPVQKMSCNSFPPPGRRFILEIDVEKCVHGSFF